MSLLFRAILKIFLILQPLKKIKPQIIGYLENHVNECLYAQSSYSPYSIIINIQI